MDALSGSSCRTRSTSYTLYRQGKRARKIERRRERRRDEQRRNERESEETTRDRETKNREVFGDYTLLQEAQYPKCETRTDDSPESRQCLILCILQDSQANIHNCREHAASTLSSSAPEATVTTAAATAVQVGNSK
uniref:Uncharacterized protein n=1 Tax=Trichogramma kaykai TaxID=54128 RepID=A0ABD2WJK0_9HYME